ncbi:MULTISPECIES: DUF1150 family protein [Paracoccus]|jgi:hypothetical protein|uniref:DUF1150 family protein n=1 Tax=Paracoccus aerius TaxID=1915382 RepID=A0ABS1S4B0_9RHOB|nr:MULTISPECIES: DUF1150 family protein [Paracoccus]MBL3673549.1 DUF1150 family protein [Paracoccus aerius]QIR85354.1 DUF1150 family protein [Paracoccus sp. AK26]GHG20334.1 hypothetical protein GCM10017322_17060 [Paracoccus aerius]
MDTKFDFGGIDAERTVYIRQVETSSLPQELRQQLDGIDSMYAVHDIDGERLALVKDRQLAFVLARQNELTPVSVH